MLQLKLCSAHRPSIGSFNSNNGPYLPFVRISRVHNTSTRFIFATQEKLSSRGSFLGKLYCDEHSREYYHLESFQAIHTECTMKQVSQAHLFSSKETIEAVIGFVGFFCLASRIISSAARTHCISMTPISYGGFAMISSTLYSQPPTQAFSFPDLGFIRKSLSRVSYMLDVILERNLLAYILLLIFVCIILISFGGFLFSKFSNEESTDEPFWKAWACLISSSTHLKERTPTERAIGFTLAIGGLLFYSLLTSTMTAQFKRRMEWLREGAHSEVVEEGHVVICGFNNHMTTILKQLNTSHGLALRDGSSWHRKQTVLLLSEHDRKQTENMIFDAFKDLPCLNILTRSGSLSSTLSFEKVGVHKARSVIVLAPNRNRYEADAESVLTVLALQPLLDTLQNVVVEVYDVDTMDLLKASTTLNVNPLQNLSSKILVQCSRQPGLIDVYRELLEQDKQIINLRNYPSLAGISYEQVRRGFSEAIVCGLIRDGRIQFHPQEDLQLIATDKLMVICKKNEYKVAPNIVAKMNGLEDTDNIKGSSTVAVHTNFRSSIAKSVSKGADWQAGPKERILILGWHPRVSEMILEYDDYIGPGSELIILAETPIGEREHHMKRRITKQLQNVHVIHQVGNPLSRVDLKEAILHPSISRRSKKTCKPTENANMPLSVLVISEKSKLDKQSALSLLLAEDTCKQLDIKVVSLVAEFENSELGKQVMGLRPSLTVIGTDEIDGLVTSQVAEQPELNVVWTELLNSWGNEIYVKDIRRYIRPGEIVSFQELSERAVLHDEVAIGYRINSNSSVINPPVKDKPLEFLEGDALVVISESEYSSKGFYTDW